MAAAEDRQVCVGVIAGVHGVRGAVVVKPFTQTPEDVAAYGPVSTASGAIFALEVIGRKKSGLIVRIAGLDDRDRAEALKGEKLFVARSQLPEPEEESWYISDLAGLEVVDVSGKRIGSIAAVQNYGAGDLLEIRLPEKGKATVFLPFTRAVVPGVDIARRQIVVDPPEGWLDGKEA
jgi:16S rRNA processing protein RimM